jgi:hypothetical protein
MTFASNFSRLTSRFSLLTSIYAQASSADKAAAFFAEERGEM